MFIIAGVVFYYSLLQLAMFWLCHVLALFWKIRFPFHSRSFQMAHRTKYVHMAAVVLCILVPFVPIVATMSQYGHGRSSVEAATGGLGFGITRFPPLLCTGRHADTTFYSLILPILVILMIGMTILLIIFWIIHRVSHTIIIIFSERVNIDFSHMQGHHKFSGTQQLLVCTLLWLVHE